MQLQLLLPSVIVTLLSFSLHAQFGAAPSQQGSTSLASNKTITIIALGDSLTEGYGLSKEESYPSQLQNLLRQTYPQLKIINAGISGSTSAGAESRLKWQLKNKPDILLLALGANDGLRGLSVSAMKKNLQGAIELAQKNKVHVILAGMKMPMNYGDAYRKEYEAAFTEVSKKYKTDFIPFLLEGVATNKDLNLADGIHPNAEGYKKIAQQLLPIFKKTIDNLKK